MKVLVACEFSGVVRDSFLAKGHDAMSCDLLPTMFPGPHYQGDVRDILGDGWDMMIAHPPCTYLARSGLHWNKRIPGRDKLTDKALDFVRTLMKAPIRKIALENPVGAISSNIEKPTQIIHPYQFWHDASKATCLWLKGLPKLVPTCYIPPRMVNGKFRWANQSDSGQSNVPESKDRWMKKSITYVGIAAAMADQWGGEPSSFHIKQCCGISDCTVQADANPTQLEGSPA